MVDRITFKKQWVTTKDSVVYALQNSTVYRLQALLWELKDALVNPTLGGVWTVLASSDGTTANTNDNWIDPTDAVHGTSSTGARGWILLKSPTGGFGPYYMLIDNWHTSNNYRCQIYFTRSQPNISSPSTTARPPATGSEWSHADAYPADYSNANYYAACHCAVADDGSFFFAAQLDTEVWGQYVAFNIWDPDTVHAAETIGASSLVWGGDNNKKMTDGATIWQSLHPPDNTQVALAQISYMIDGVQTARKIHQDAVDNNWKAMPAYLFSTVATKYSIRGALGDLYLAHDYERDGVPAYDMLGMKACKFGPYWVPHTALPRT